MDQRQQVRLQGYIGCSEKDTKDKVLCSALVDRLCHKSYLVNMTGTSYRIKETKKIIGNK